MKTKELIISITLLISFSCSTKNINNENKTTFLFYPAYNSLAVNNDFAGLLDKFIDETSPNASIYLLIVDKTLDNTALTLIANNYSSEYLNQHNPLFYFIRKNKKVYVVNGFESFFKPKYEEFSRSKSEVYYKMVSYVFAKDSIITYKQGIIPFATLPIKLDSIK